MPLKPRNEKWNILMITLLVRLQRFVEKSQLNTAQMEDQQQMTETQTSNKSYIFLGLHT
jgi:hypothetical protein